ncbi:MAG: tetratricopeptide repeat protein, partial [Phycisphaerae bacterium]
LDPRHADARFNLADVLAARKQYAQAIGYYREAISIDPDQPAYRINLANALRSIGRLDEAIAEYRQAIRLDPEVPEIYRNLGDVLVLAGYYEQAVEALRQVIAKKPDDWLACNNLAWLLATCPDEGVRDGQQAVVLAKRARRLRGPNDPQTLDTLAAAYAEAGQFERAIETQVRAVRLAAAEKKDLYLRRLGLYRAGRAVRMAAPGR